MDLGLLDAPTPGGQTAPRLGLQQLGGLPSTNSSASSTGASPAAVNVAGTVKTGSPAQGVTATPFTPSGDSLLSQTEFSAGLRTFGASSAGATAGADGSGGGSNLHSPTTLSSTAAAPGSSHIASTAATPNGGTPTSGNSSSKTPSFQITDVRDSHNQSVLHRPTNDHLTVVGTAPAGASMTVFADGRPSGTTKASSTGTWQVHLGALADGTHTITAAPTGTTALKTGGVPIQIDTTAPAIKVSMPEFVTRPMSQTLNVQITNPEPFGVVPVAHVDVDLNHDGKFEANELNYATVALAGPTGGAGPLSRALGNGTWTLRVRVSDNAGNQGFSNTVTTQVNTNEGFIGDSNLLAIAGSGGLASLNLNAITGVGTQKHAVVPFTDSLGSGTIDLTDWLWDSQGRVMVHVRATLQNDVAGLSSALAGLGMNVLRLDPAQNMVTGYIPVNQILAMANLPNFAAAVAVPRPVLRTGAVDSQGDQVLLAQQFRQTTGFDGTGVKVGVLSDSVNQFAGGLGDSQATGDLGPVQIIEDGPAGSTDEGRAMLEIVHDLAPGAALAFATAAMSQQDFASNIVNLQQAGAQVICDDVGYADEPKYNDGIIAQAAQQVHDSGAFYASAAGNNANFAFETVWKSVSATVGGITGTFLDLGGGNALQAFTLQPGDQTVLDCQWNQAFLEGGSPLPNFQVPSEIDVLVLDSSGNVIQTLNSNNLNTGEAFQFGAITNNTNSTNFSFAFHLVQGPAPTRLWWTAFSGADPMAAGEGAATIFGHPAARGAVAVGAADWQTPTTPEIFSALGGNLEFFFDANGNPLPSPEVRFKPDATATDGVSTTFFEPGTPDGNGFFSFFGTSAATPHVAAAAALLINQTTVQFGTPATNDQIEQHLKDTAIPIGSPIPNPVTGPGLIQITPITTPPGGGGGGGGGVPGGDQWDPNETSDTAFNFGVLTTQATLSANLHDDVTTGLPDYDWFRWSAGRTGSLTASLSITSGAGPLEIHLFTLAGNTMLELPQGGVVAGGAPILVEVKGVETSPGVFGQAAYDLTVNLT
jgi:hypothetical protein